jgi:dihydropyrimidinase
VLHRRRRDKANQDVLWNAVRTDVLSAISTDHCAFLWDGQKTIGKDDFSKIPNGGPGPGEPAADDPRVRRRGGRISLNRMVELSGTNPAKLFGLYPRKGTIAVGSDATSSSSTPRRGDDLRGDAALEVGLQPVRGHRGDGLAGGRAAARQRARRGRRARRAPGIGQFVARAKFGQELKPGVAVDRAVPEWGLSLKRVRP